MLCTKIRGIFRTRGPTIIYAESRNQVHKPNGTGNSGIVGNASSMYFPPQLGGVANVSSNHSEVLKTRTQKRVLKLFTEEIAKQNPEFKLKINSLLQNTDPITLDALRENNQLIELLTEKFEGKFSKTLTANDFDLVLKYIIPNINGIKNSTSEILSVDQGLLFSSSNKVISSSPPSAPVIDSPTIPCCSEEVAGREYVSAVLAGVAVGCLITGIALGWNPVGWALLIASLVSGVGSAIVPKVTADRDEYTSQKEIKVLPAEVVPVVPAPPAEAPAPPAEVPVVPVVPAPSALLSQVVIAVVKPSIELDLAKRFVAFIKETDSNDPKSKLNVVKSALAKVNKKMKFIELLRNYETPKKTKFIIENRETHFSSSQIKLNEIKNALEITEDILKILGFYPVMKRSFINIIKKLFEKYMKINSDSNFYNFLFKNPVLTDEEKEIDVELNNSVKSLVEAWVNENEDLPYLSEEKMQAFVVQCVKEILQDTELAKEANPPFNLETLRAKLV